ncbi:MAG: hypothetical protein J6M30_02085 [Bacteroidales bacterium]|nr:hypothetical protein [Bacteroidales bacterium]
MQIKLNTERKRYLLQAITKEALEWDILAEWVELQEDRDISDNTKESLQKYCEMLKKCGLCEKGKPLTMQEARELIKRIESEI